MKSDTKRYLGALAVLIGSCIGAGVLGIPFVASQAGFFVALFYIIFLGGIFLLINLYLGEISLRTKGDHQLIGYTEKYLGKKAKHLMEFATVFGIYAILIAYMLGIGKSFSYLIFENLNYEIHIGILVGLIMSYFLFGGLKSLKKFEKIGVSIILGLFFVIMLIFSPQIILGNLFGFNKTNLFLPFGVVLFALMSFHAIPEVRLVLKNKEKLLKKVIITGLLISVIFYSLFTFVVTGYMGSNTPEVATLALGSFFIFLGILTMFTSYFASGDALRENFEFDERYSRKKSWFMASIIPIGLFVLTQLTEFFSFTTILSLGGIISGGIIAILILLMIKKAKLQGNRKPEYSIPFNWFVTTFLILIFILGVIKELFF
ncbi:MAG: aromatic amino acid transport family protein [Nanoarchaeota archaeon]|nr:aromatic amino acid transport family protein [Nanoarchaeota archaeon]